MEISMAKLFCGRMARYVADECIQLHGGFGYMKESKAGRAFVDTPPHLDRWRRGRGDDSLHGQNARAVVFVLPDE